MANEEKTTACNKTSNERAFRFMGLIKKAHFMTFASFFCECDVNLWPAIIRLGKEITKWQQKKHKTATKQQQSGNSRLKYKSNEFDAENSVYPVSASGNNFSIYRQKWAIIERFRSIITRNTTNDTKGDNRIEKSSFDLSSICRSIERSNESQLELNGEKRSFENFRMGHGKLRKSTKMN